jgi:predicted ATPase/DNA-binding CsgD family transcriptional regulator
MRVEMNSDNQFVEPLTRREKDILTLLSQNLTDRQIAEQLMLSQHTVKWYSHQLLGKLDAANRQEAVAKARELGMLGGDAPVKPVVHNLPRQPSSFIGRENEISQVNRLIWQYPLVTLTGAGGVGKTRLAQVAAGELVDNFTGGIWYVELAALSDPLLVPQAVVDVLGSQAAPGSTAMSTLQAFFRGSQALLVLDNCEHLVQACAELIHDLLGASPHLRVLATSREPLGVAGEALFRVPSLSVPAELGTEAGEDLIDYEAVHLFVERARASLPGFELNKDNAGVIATICRRLDGIPLAIELAAARVRGLPVDTIAARLDRAFTLLTGGSRAALPRHQTLRALIDWSYQLLAPAERLLLLRLAVFAGGWTLEAAEAVCADPPDTHPTLLDQENIANLLGALVDRSLIQYEPKHGEAPRYTLLETVRQYTLDRLIDSGAIETMRARHLDYFLTLAHQAEPYLQSKQAGMWVAQLNRELENLRLAMESSLTLSMVKGLQFVVCLEWFWWYVGQGYKTARWMEQWLELREQQGGIQNLTVEERVLLGMALYVASKVTVRNTDWVTESLDQLRRNMAMKSAAIFAELGDSYRPNYVKARMALSQSVEDFIQCRELLLPLNNPSALIMCDHNLALRISPEDERVKFFAEEGLALSRQIGDLTGEGLHLRHLGEFELFHGNEQHFLELMQAALERFETTGNMISAAQAHYVFADYFTPRDNYQQADWHVQAIITVARELRLNEVYHMGMIVKTWLALTQKKFDQVISYCHEILELNKDFHLKGRIFFYCLLSRALLSKGKLTEAQAIIRQYFSVDSFHYYRSVSYITLHTLGVIAAKMGQMAMATTLFGVVEGQFGLGNYFFREMSSHERGEYEQALAATRVALSPEAFEAAWNAGRAMPLEQVMKIVQEG